MTRVCLIAEGSYPYVTGGVGKWAHDLISSMPDVEFTVAALWPAPGVSGPARYPRPRNLRDVIDVHLFSGTPPRGAMPAETFPRIDALQGALFRGEAACLDGIPGRFRASKFLEDKRSWELVCRHYEALAPGDLSFQDFYWTWRSTVEPVFRILETELPECSVIHAISTGYAGLLGAAQKAFRGAPLILTEHGLYTRERAQELWDADWIPGDEYARLRRSGNFFKDWWARLFLSLEKTAYASADAVVSLFEATRQYQVSHGAAVGRTRVIPNGIDLGLLEAVPRHPRPDRFHVGLVGRVVPIKDVRVFIAACQILARQAAPTPLEVSIIGPGDEDPDYAEQCREMVRLLGLSGNITFTGRVDSRTFYEVLDVVVLTSLSEGQPLVILEALACGIPVVATDVGACRELLEGSTPEDRADGAAGLLTLPADPEGTAAALLRLLREPGLRASMQAAGRRRVARRYRLEQVRESYFDLYRSLADGRR